MRGLHSAESIWFRLFDLKPNTFQSTHRQFSPGHRTGWENKNNNPTVDCSSQWRNHEIDFLAFIARLLPVKISGRYCSQSKWVKSTNIFVFLSISWSIMNDLDIGFCQLLSVHIFGGDCRIYINIPLWSNRKTKKKQSKLYVVLNFYFSDSSDFRFPSLAPLMLSSPISPQLSRLRKVEVSLVRPPNVFTDFRLGIYFRL